MRSTSQFADVMRQVADGAGRLVIPGLSTVQGGQGQLASALGQARDGVAAVQPQLDSLAGGAQSLLATGGELLEASGSRAAPLISELESGLGDASTRIDTVRDQLRDRRGPFQPLRSLRRLELDSPGFFRSGYVVAAGLEGAQPAQRDAIAGLVDSAGGGKKARILVLPDVPTNDPRQDRVVDDVRALARRFERTTGVAAPVGGTAPELTDFARVNGTRVPLIIARDLPRDLPRADPDPALGRAPGDRRRAEHAHRRRRVRSARAAVRRRQPADGRARASSTSSR